MAENNNEDMNEALLSAAKSGDVAGCRSFIERGVDVDCSNSLGYTPALIAAEEGQVEVFQLIAEYGANLSVRVCGKTPAFAAATAGHIEILKLLAEKGADLSVGDRDGRTPVYMAALEGHVEILKLLAENGADILKNLRKAERSIKELTFAGDEDKKNHERMQSLIDQLQGKVKSYKKQIEEAEEIAALNLAKYRKVAGALGDAAAAADAAEQEAAMRKARARSASLI